MLLTSREGMRVITDPYTPGMFGLDYAPIKENADVVTVSHDHGDHNNVSSIGGSPDVVTETGTSKVSGLEFRGIPCYHDDSSGKDRGRNIIFCFTLGFH